MRTCKQCNESIENKPKQQIFCSLSCGQTYNVPRKTAVFYFECVHCLKLQVTTDSKKQFCNRSCAASFNNKITKRKHSIVCNNATCSNVRSKNSFKYCSIKCRSEQHRRIAIDKWLSKEWNGATADGLSSTIKRYLKEQANYRCQSPACAYPGGWSEVNPSSGRIPVEIDHIDGDYTNNLPENLIVICPSCHALTPTYKALNKNGRHKRRVRYATGASY